MKTIDHEKFLELAERLEGAPPEMKRVTTLLKELGQLMGKFNKAEGLEEKEAAWNELQARRQVLDEEFAELCSEWGVSPDDAKHYVENPANYSVAEWREVQEVKTEVYTAVKEEKTSRQPKRRLRKWV